MNLQRHIPAGALVRPPARARDVVTTLADFAIITWAIAPERLARHLPPGFEPDVAYIDGAARALISAVPFRDLDFRFRFAPFLRFHFGQTNYRAYVRHGGQRSVWFFGTALATFWVWWPRYWWKLPWHRARLDFDCSWDGERCTRYRHTGRSSWGDSDVDLVGSGEPTGVLPGFADAEETALVLTHPLDGYFTRRDGHVGTYSVWHDRLTLTRASVTRARFEVFERLGLVDPGQAPHSALVQRATEFVIRLPPRRYP